MDGPAHEILVLIAPLSIIGSGELEQMFRLTSHRQSMKVNEDSERNAELERG